MRYPCMGDAFAHFKRLAKRWLRDPKAVVASLVEPAAWLIFVGLAMPATFTADYLAYVTPGIMVMAVLFSSLAGGSLLSYDRLQGFLSKFLALPAPRESILFGNVGFITFRGLLQAAIILAMALLFGVTLPGPVGDVLMLASLALFGIFLSALTITLGLIIEDIVELSTFCSMISMPLFFSSSALMPYDKMPPWLRGIASVNPVSIVVDSVRHLMSGNIPYLDLMILAIMGIMALMFCTYVFRKATI